MSSRGSDVESKVVELSFQNSQFEQNAKTSISTLERLKNALNLSKNAKVFDEIDRGVKKVNVSSLSSGVEALSGKLNSLKSIAAFAMIADEAIKAKNAVEGFAKSVTVDQIGAGFDKYAKKTSAVQTIMAATAKSYSDTEQQMADVNAQLEKLNWFTDETSFNFVDMVENIGKFTSNNIALNDSVTAMQGISTWAAVSGASVTEASRAMYNLSQAIAVGAVKLMDWKSIENANMATAEFKETAMETAAELGLLTKAADGVYKTVGKGTEVTVSTFNSTLSEAWFTSDVLMKALDRYGGFTNELYDLMEKVDGEAITSDVLEFLDQYKEGSLDFQEASEAMGMSVSELKTEFAALSDDALNLGLKAFKAAQEAKTFGEAVDSVKDAVSTGWMKTFEALFGDYEHAKVLWTKLAEDMYDIFAAGGDDRNELLKKAFTQQQTINDSDWKKLEESGIASPEFVKAIKSAASAHNAAAASITDSEIWLQNALQNGTITMDDFNAAFQQVFGGGSGGTAVDAGIKSLVENARDTDDAFKELLATIEKYGGEEVGDIVFGDHKVAEGSAGELEQTLDQIITSLGLTQEEGTALVTVLQDLGYLGGLTEKSFEDAEKSAKNGLETADALDEKFGRVGNKISDTQKAYKDFLATKKTAGEIWQETLITGMDTLVSLFKVAKEAWEDVFPPMTTNTIIDIVNGVHSAVEQFSNFVEESDELKTVLTGVFSAFSIVKNVAFALGETALKSLRAVIDGLGIDIGGTVVKVAELITKFNEWIQTTGVLKSASSFIVGMAGDAAKAVRGWVDAFLKLPLVEHAITNFKSGFKQAGAQIFPFFDGLKGKIGEFRDRIGMLGGIRLDNIADVFGAFGDTIGDFVTNFSGFDGIKKAFTVLKRDIKSALGSIGIDVDKVAAKISSVTNFIAGIPSAIGGWAVNTAKNIQSLWDKFSQMPAVQTALSNFKNGFKDFTTNFGNWISEGKDKFEEFIQSIQSMDGFSLDTIASVFEGLWNFISDRFSSIPGFDEIAEGFRNLAEAGKEQLKSLGIDVDSIRQKIEDFVTNVKTKLESFNISSIQEVFTGLFSFFGNSKSELETPAEETIGILERFGNAVAGAFSAIEPYISKIYTWIRPIALLAGAFLVFKSLKSLEHIIRPETIKKQGEGFKGAAAGILMISASIYILAQALKLIESLDTKELPKVLGIITGLALGLVIIAKVLSGMEGLKGAGIAIASIVGSMYLLLLLFKVLENYHIDNLTNVATNLGIMIAAIAVCLLATRAAGKNAAGAGAAALAISVALIIMVGALKLIETIDASNISKIVGVMVILVAALSALMFMSKFVAKGSTGSILAIAATIAVLAFAVADLASLPADDLIRASVCIGILLGVIALVAFAAGTLKDANKSMLILVALVGLISFALYELVKTDADGAMKVALSLTALFASLALLMGVLTFVGTFGTAALLGLGQLALVILGIGVVAGIIGALVHYFPQLEEFLNTGLEILIDIADGVGRLFGALVGGFSEEVASYLPGIADSLVGFVEHLQPLNDLEGINFVVLTEALGAILEIGLGELIGGVLDLVPQLVDGKTGCQLFADNLDAIAGALSRWQTSLDGIGTITIPTDSIAELTGNILMIDFAGLFGAIMDAVVYLVSSKSAAEHFADDVDTLATALTSWEEKMNGLDTITIPTEGINELRQSISKIKGDEFWTAISEFVANWLNDENKTLMDRFSEDTGTLAETLSNWQNKMEEIGDITVPEDSLAKLTEAVKAVPESGVLEAIDDWLVGQTDVDTFKENIGKLGDALKAFSDSIGSDFNQATVDSAADALNVFTGIGTTLQRQGITSVNYDQLASGIDAITQVLPPFATMDIDIGNLTQISDAANLLSKAIFRISKIKIDESSISNQLNVGEFKSNVDSLKEMINGLNDLDDSGVSKFVNAVNTVAGADISSATTKLQEQASNSTQSVDMSSNGADIVNSMASGVTDNAGTLTDAIGTLADAAAEASQGLADKFRSVGEAFAKAVAEALSSSGEPAAAASSMAADAASAADGSKGGFYDAGYNGGMGFANGIAGSTTYAVAYAKALASQALQAIKNAFQIKSPSRVMYGIGRYFVMGFSNAVQDYTPLSTDASKAMGTKTVESMREAIATARDILSSDMDSEPVIRPVLDLSEIRGRAKAISNLIGLNRPVGVLGELGTISANSVAIRQTASNDDLYSALMDLKGESGLGGGDTYNINGITYDDGTNVATAVKSLIHAARVERRS